eukprot:8925617-Alexandrium_andersonii.AAC.1
MAKTPWRKANQPPQRPFRALPGLPANGRRTMGESALTEQLGVPLRGAPELPCESTFAHSTAPVKRRVREGSE